MAATEAETVEILIKATGREEVEKSAKDSLTALEDVFNRVAEAYNTFNGSDLNLDQIVSLNFDDITKSLDIFVGRLDQIGDSAGLAQLRSAISYLSDEIEGLEIDLEMKDDVLGQIEQLRDMVDAEYQVRLGVELDDITDVDTSGFDQIQGVLDLFKGMDTIGLGNLFDLSSVEEFSDAISDLHENNLSYLLRTLQEIRARVENLDIDISVKGDAVAQLDMFIDRLNQVDADPVEEALAQIQEVINSLDRGGGIDLSNIFTTDGIDDMAGAIQHLTEQQVRELYDALTQAVREIEHLNIDETIKNETISQLREYLDLIERINQEHKETSGEGGTQLEQFLGRYKYSLLLIGGAIGGIMGMMRYSTVFGTTLDLIGTAIGYLADTILFPLIPALMWMVDLIIGAADWFNQLPDSVKTVVSAIFGLVAVFMILRAVGIIALIQGILTALWSLATGATAAGALTGSGLILGILAGLAIGFAAVYLLMQTGGLKAIAEFSKGFKENFPLLYDAFAVLGSVLGLVGVVINTALSGQFDKIPENLQIALGMAGNYFMAFGARILEFVTSLLSGPIAWLMEVVAGIGQAWGTQIKNIGTFGKAVVDVFKSAITSALDFFTVIGEGGKNLPFIGDKFKGLSDWSKGAKESVAAFEDPNALAMIEGGDEMIEFWNRFGSSAEENVDLAIRKWREMAEEFEGRNAIQFDKNMEGPTGDILNGFTSEDQIKAIMKEQEDALKKLMPQMTLDSSITGDTFDYSNVSASADKFYELNAAQEAAIDAQKELNDALYGPQRDLYSADQIEVLRNNLESAEQKVEDLRKALFDLNGAISDVGEGMGGLSPAAPGGVQSVPSGSVPSVTPGQVPQQVSETNITNHNTITIQGYNKDAKTLAREIGPELAKMWDLNTRATRI